jgi:long-chain acyl-CoA synthetase
VRMLTSGTTGAPKRVDLGYEMLERVLVGAKHYESSRDETIRLRRGVAIVNSPLVHLGGLFRVLQCVADGRSFSLLERFSVDTWVEAVRRHRPATASLVPAALRMVLEADLDPDDLSSLRSVVSGTAPLDPDDADAFTARYGVPVLVSYAATEFGGGVAGWNIEDHRTYWSSKRGSVGRAHAGCELRVVEPSTGTVLEPDQEGLLEVKASQLDRDDWVRTTDIARIDSDGFVYILGRADQAIIRGGFKIRPEDVRAALERHPAVRGAAVVARTDERLGAVPVAMVELRADTGAGVTSDELLSYAAQVLARYELPAELRVVDALPRTDSGKVDLAEVTARLEHASAGG